MSASRMPGAAGEVDVHAMVDALLKALDYVGVGFVVTTDDGGADGPRPVFVTQQAAEILGRPAAELVGTPALPSLTPEERARLAHLREARLAGLPGVPRRYETVVERPDGTRLPIEVGSAPMTLNGLPATAAFFFDISDRRRAEAALAESEARFRTLVEASRDVAMVCRADETLVYANPALARLLGYDSVSELIGEPAARFVHPDEIQEMRARWPALREHPDPAAVERRVRHKSGHFVTLEAHTVAVQFDGAAAVLIMARDVTQRRLEQQRLLQQDRMAAVGTLAAGVAHEINNPLAYVMLNLDLVARELPRAAGDPSRLADLRDKLREAKDGAERVAMIVRDLLTFARADESWGPCDLGRCIDTAVKMVRTDLRRRGQLVLDIGDVSEVDGNHAKLGQVVLNLVMNAMQALPPGGAPDAEVRVRVAEEGDWVVLEVSDTGPGIPDDVLPRIFEPFFTTKPAGEGTGLGLTICHGIITSMGGEIRARNLLGRGAAFTVRLPVPLRFRPERP